MLCEKCETKMKYIKEGCGICWTCPHCNWGYATSYFEPIELDHTQYGIFLSGNHEATLENIKLIAGISGFNYLRTREVLKSENAIIFKGSALEIKAVLLRLRVCGIKYHVAPDFPYDLEKEG